MKVLVTGAFGLVGSATVRKLASDGRTVVVTDLDIPGNRKAAEGLPPGVSVEYADLTDPDAVDRLIASVSPSAIIHLAAIIPPFIYMRRELARKVNVDGTAALLAAAQKQANPPRFIQASSIGVYGSRNPYRVTDLLTADTPINPADVYGQHKAEAEKLVRASTLDWVILRLGGVLTVEPRSLMNLDNMYLESLLPIDNRVQTVDVRDVATAFAAATTADVVGETLLIGGDDSHRHVYGDVAPAFAAAMGLVDGVPTGLKGDPSDDDSWFNTDWMDTARAQEALGYQHHSWADMLIEASDKMGWKRGLLRVGAPLARAFATRKGAYYRSGRAHAAPWAVIAEKWADPRPDASAK
jgi:nucleoside-diphosphate-sugar epimerase